MKSDLIVALVIAAGMGACAKGPEGTPSPLIDWAPWVKKEDALVSTLKRKQDANLARLAQQKALEQELKEQAARARSSSRKARVPPSMYRTAEPPLPEPDFSLPVSDVPRSAPSASPSRQ